MSSSVPGSKIDMLDSEEEVIKKINKAVCEEGTLNNGLLPFIKYVIMVLKEDKKQKFVIERQEKFGGNKSYSKYEEIEKDFLNKKLHPMDLKKALAKEISNLIAPVRANQKLQKLYKDAYE